MKKYIIIILTIALVLQSCEKEFKLKGSSDPKIYVYGLAGASDTTMFNVVKTIPIGSKAHYGASREVSFIELRVNGNPVSLKKADENTDGVPKGFWWTKEEIPAQAKLSIIAKATDAKDISASIVTPKAFPDFEAKFTSFPSITVTFEDDANTQDCYGILVIREVNMVKDGVVTIITESCPPYIEEEEYDLIMRGITDYIDIPLKPGNYNTTARLWIDRKFNGEKVSLNFNISEYNYEGTVREYDSVKNRYKAYLYRISPEFFKYAEAQNHRDNNMLAMIGLAPAAFAYSNVQNGLGVFAGATVTETEWFE